MCPPSSRPLSTTLRRARIAFHGPHSSPEFSTSTFPFVPHAEGARASSQRSPRQPLYSRYLEGVGLPASPPLNRPSADPRRTKASTSPPGETATPYATAGTRPHLARPHLADAEVVSLGLTFCVRQAPIRLSHHGRDKAECEQKYTNFWFLHYPNLINISTRSSYNTFHVPINIRTSPSSLAPHTFFPNCHRYAHLSYNYALSLH